MTNELLGSEIGTWEVAADIPSGLSPISSKFRVRRSFGNHAQQDI
jgi:hypothetical protein